MGTPNVFGSTIQSAQQNGTWRFAIDIGNGNGNRVINSLSISESEDQNNKE